MGLLHLLYSIREKMSLHISVAHFDHRLRGDESRRDAEFVRAMAEDLGLDFHVGSGNVKDLSREKGISIQEAARFLRYEFLKDVHSRTGSSKVLTAHTADDQAEELLLRLTRGCSLAGLSGIPWSRDGWIARPILDFTKQELMDFLGRHKIPYVVDSSNREDKYLRNRMRHMVLPLLRKHFNPSIVRTLTNSADIIAEDHVFLEDMAKKALNDCIVSGANATGVYTLDAERLAGLPRALRRRAIRLTFQKLEISMGRAGSRHILALDALLEKAKPWWKFSLPGGWMAARVNNLLCFTREYRRPDPSIPAEHTRTVEVRNQGIWPAPTGSGYVEIVHSEQPNWAEIKQRRDFPRPLFMEMSRVKFPLILRTRQPGERFWPLGGPTPYKLKDFLISRKIPRNIRDELPLLACDGEILAVLGVEIAHPYRICSSRSKCLRVTWTP